MPDDPMDELMDSVFDFGEEGQYRLTDYRERSVNDQLVFEFEPENPYAEKLDKSLFANQLESKTAKGEITHGTPDPRRVHESRSEYAQKQDLARDARITTDPDQYASDPNSYDFPGIDTGPTFRDVEDDFDEESFLDSIL